MPTLRMAAESCGEGGEGGLARVVQGRCRSGVVGSCAWLQHDCGCSRLKLCDPSVITQLDGDDGHPLELVDVVELPEAAPGLGDELLGAGHVQGRHVGVGSDHLRIVRRGG